MTIMDTPIIVLNWKLYCNDAHTHALAEAVHNADTPYNVVVAPATPFLSQVARIVHGNPHVSVAAQNCDTAIEGPHTGDISPRDLQAIGATYCIVGHSEQRAQSTHEEVIEETVTAMLPYLIPIVCVGDTSAVREHAASREIIEAQLTADLKNMGEHKKAIIAYEPRWAISQHGKGQSASDDDIVAMVACIKEFTMGSYPVLYGGAVTPGNRAHIMSLPNVDGVLIGHASTQIDSLTHLLSP